MNNIDDSVEKKMFDYTELISEQDNEGTWIILGISLFMIIVLIWIVFL